MKESILIEKIIEMFYKKDKSIIKGPGDDCAIIDFNDRKHYFLFTVDEIVEDTHFILSFLKPSEVASKLVRMNVSDIYAMGDATPLYCLLSGGIDFKKISDRWIEEFLNALKKEIEAFSMVNIGGNLTRSKTLFFSMTIIGRVNKKAITKRTGAKSGDIICCCGRSGMAKAAVEIISRKKREELSDIEKRLIKYFTHPRIYSTHAGLLSHYVTSMIDNSDGLYRSVEIISQANKLKCVIDIEKLYNLSNKDLKMWTRANKRDIIDYILFGGEDYNLIFTIDKKNFESVIKKLDDVFEIGYVCNGEGVEVRGYDGRDKSFEHF